MGQLPGKEKSAEDPSHTLVDGGNLVPHGVYSAAQDYSHQIVRHLITHRRLAPFYKGVDDEEHYKDAVANTECPICFLYQPSPLNMSRCCEQPICTECFVQIKRADPTHTNPPSSEPAACPFCMTEDFGIIYVPPKPRQPSGGDGTDMPTGPTPARRRKSFGPTDPEVVTIDMIRPDWAQKLQHAQAAIARRANRRIIMRQVGDRLIPIGVTSGRAAEMLEGMSGTLGSGSSGPGGAIILQENERWLSTSQRAALAAQAALHSGDGAAAAGGAGEASSTSRREGSGGGVSGSSSDDRRRERRRHNQDLSEYLRTLGGGPDMEEIMLMEAMRLSLLEHEEEERRRTAASEPTSNAAVTAAAPTSVSEAVIPTHSSSISAHPPPPVPEPIPVPSPAPAPAALPSVNPRTELQRSAPASIPASGGRDQSRALEEAMQDLMASPATSAAASVAISPATATARPAALISTDSRGGATPTQSTFSVPKATGSSSLATTFAASSSSAHGTNDESASGEVNSSAAPPSPASAVPTYPVSPSRLQPPSITTTPTSGTTVSRDADSSSLRAESEADQGGLGTTSPWVSFQDDSGIPPTPASERSMGDLGAQGFSR